MGWGEGRGCIASQVYEISIMIHILHVFTDDGLVQNKFDLHNADNISFEFIIVAK